MTGRLELTRFRGDLTLWSGLRPRREGSKELRVVDQLDPLERLQLQQVAAASDHYFSSTRKRRLQNAIVIWIADNDINATGWHCKLESLCKLVNHRGNLFGTEGELGPTNDAVQLAEQISTGYIDYRTRGNEAQDRSGRTVEEQAGNDDVGVADDSQARARSARSAAISAATSASERSLRSRARSPNSKSRSHRACCAK